MIFLARLASERNGPETRREILNLLTHEQGLTKSQICQRLDLAWGTVSHHVRVLEREKALVRRRFLGFNRLYTAEARSPEVSLMPLLRDSLVPHILERIQASPGIGIQALSRELALGRKVVRRQLQALVENGLLERTDDYRPRFYLCKKAEMVVHAQPPSLPGQPAPPSPAAGELREDMPMHF